jgi:hypothetical protein
MHSIPNERPSAVGVGCRRISWRARVESQLELSIARRLEHGEDPERNQAIPEKPRLLELPEPVQHWDGQKRTIGEPARQRIGEALAIFHRDDLQR